MQGFACSDQVCISKKWVCDGEIDCHNGADEKVFYSVGLSSSSLRDVIAKWYFSLHSICAGHRDWVKVGEYPYQVHFTETQHVSWLSRWLDYTTLGYYVLEWMAVEVFKWIISVPLPLFSF